MASDSFFELAKQGRIPPGSYLIIENLDRLSREDERTALRLWMDILDCKINIVQLTPETIFRHDKSDMMDIMRAIIELSRGHSESARKSERVGSAWQEKKKRAAQRPVTERVPAWVELRDGKLHAVPSKAETVRLIFRLARNGYGIGVITRKLNKDGVGTLGKHEVKQGKKRSAFAKCWARSYVAKILHNRAVLGEYQPYIGRGSGRRPDGDPVPGYYPQLITEDEWHAAHAGLTERKNKTGRNAKGELNLFAHLLKDSRDGESLSRVDKGRKSGIVLVSGRGMAGVPGSKAVSFPFPTFETAILAMLWEVDHAEIIAQGDGPDEVAILCGELAMVESKIAAFEAELLNGDVAALAKALRTLEAQRKEIGEKLAAARQRAASPVSEAWKEARSLLAVIASAPDPEDARLRLRAVLRRIVESIWVLVVPNGRDRVAFVQIWFNGGERSRDYLIVHRPPWADGKSRKRGAWLAMSVACPTPADRGIVPGLREYRNDPAVRDYFDTRIGELASAIDEALEADIRARLACPDSEPDGTRMDGGVMKRGPAQVCTGPVD